MTSSDFFHSSSYSRLIASGSEVVASERTRIPITVGSRRSRLLGNDEIHLSIASAPPRAGIARKSP